MLPATPRSSRDRPYRHNGQPQERGVTQRSGLPTAQVAGDAGGSSWNGKLIDAEGLGASIVGSADPCVCPIPDATVPPSYRVSKKATKLSICSSESRFGYWYGIAAECHSPSTLKAYGSTIDCRR